jgi:hypothetical protein
MTVIRMLPALVVCLCATAQTQAQTALDIKTAIVTAQVQDTCKFTNPTTSLQLTLGNLDPSSTVARGATGVSNFSCTTGFTFQIGVAGQTTALSPSSSHTRQLTHRTDATQTLAYTLSVAFPNGTVGKGFSPGNELALHLTANVAASSYRDVKGGDYEDTLVVELRP